MINKPFGGLIGILRLPPPDPIAIPGLPAIDFSSKASFYFLVLILMIAVVVFINRLATSRTGQCFHAIAQHELRAEHAGINTMGYKMLAFTVGSTIAGLAGVLVAFHSRCMLPTTFTFWHGIYCLIYVAVGGGMTIAGPIAGATVFNLLSQVLRPIQTLEPIVYGFALMLVMIFFRGGLIGAFEKFRAYLMRLFKVKQMI